MYHLFILAFSFFISLLIIPSIIHVSKIRNLYDDPKKALKIHTRPTPRLGGIGIFVSFTITLLFLSLLPISPLSGFNNPSLQLNYLLAACMMLFALGLKDDLTGVGHHTKFSIELIIALLLSIPGNIRLRNLHGLFNIYELSYCTSVVLSVLILIFIINAFNLIDGIDGLAAATGIMVHLVFGALFIYMRQFELAAVCLSLSGALLGFLKYNLTPARIFMGDTGSLLIGLVSAVMTLKYIEVSDATGLATSANASSALAMALAILIGPIFDTLRVFILRLSKGSSPFQGDLSHVHHLMLKRGFNHLQTTTILVLFNEVIILMALLFL